MKKLLWVGDAGIPSGFARATHEILEVTRFAFDVTVLGINYRGDPHDYPYKIWAAQPGGDFIGVGRLIWMCDQVQPDIIVLQNDVWNIAPYLRKLRQRKPDGSFYFPEYAAIPVVGIIAVDGQNCDAEALNGLDHAIFWTQFARDEAVAGGFKGTSTVIPLGVDLDTYHPMDKYDARLRRFPQTRDLDDVFIVGNVNRNQPRKRLDLTIRYFAEWISSKNIEDAYLYLHVAPTGDTGVDVEKLARYYGIQERLIMVEPAVFYGLNEEGMCATYNCFDVQVSTTQGEGFGLTSFEGMACGVPQIAPDWSALGELLKGAAWLVPCTSTAVGPPYLGVIGGIADQGQFVGALQRLYSDPSARKRNAQAAIERANEPRYRWNNIGRAFTQVFRETTRITEERRTKSEQGKGQAGSGSLISATPNRLEPVS